jgi:hypothetical protein
VISACPAAPNHDLRLPAPAPRLIPIKALIPIEAALGGLLPGATEALIVAV